MSVPGYEAFCESHLERCKTCRKLIKDDPYYDMGWCQNFVKELNRAEGLAEANWEAQQESEG